MTMVPALGVGKDGSDDARSVGLHTPVGRSRGLELGCRDGDESQSLCTSVHGFHVGPRDRTGALQWRFLTAASHRRILAYGGLESAWPVFDLALHGGAIRASAGRHPELDGGIQLWGLDPVSGKPEWSGTIRNDTASTWMKIGDKRAGDRHVNYLTNGRLVAGDWVHGGGNKKPARNEPLEIDPANPPQ
jgi:hypothetical protein